MGEPTATQVMLTLPPGMISWLVGVMEKRGDTRRTGRRRREEEEEEEGREGGREGGKGVKNKEKKEKR